MKREQRRYAGDHRKYPNLPKPFDNYCYPKCSPVVTTVIQCHLSQEESSLLQDYIKWSENRFSDIKMFSKCEHWGYRGIFSPSTRNPWDQVQSHIRVGPAGPTHQQQKSACRLANASFLCANCVPAGPMACLLPYSCYNQSSNASQVSTSLRICSLNFRGSMLGILGMLDKSTFTLATQETTQHP